MGTDTANPATEPSVPVAGGNVAESVGEWPLGEVLRDIARGSLAGLVVGFAVAGLGGRIVMRIAALLVPSATGSFTENGNRIGSITLGGSLGLIVFVGLVVGIYLGVVWVVIAPWLPGKGRIRGLVAAPIAVGLGAFGLISRGNRDFEILAHDPLVVASLLALIAMIGPSMAFTEGWLSRRLPHARSRDSLPGSAYVVLTVIGVVLGGLLTFGAIAGRESQPLGFTTIGVGIVTLVWWIQRMRGQATPSPALRIAASLILIAGTIAGYAILVPHVTGALAIG